MEIPLKWGINENRKDRVKFVFKNLQVASWNVFSYLIYSISKQYVIMVFFRFVMLRSQIRLHLTKIKRWICIGIHPFGSQFDIISVLNLDLWSVWFVITGQFVSCLHCENVYIKSSRTRQFWIYEIRRIWNTCIILCKNWSITHKAKMLIYLF